MNTALPRFALHFLAICFLAWSLFLPDGAIAANNTITSGAFTNIYGNTGDATTPTDVNSSGNSLTLGNGSSGPTISDTSAMRIVGGQAPGDSNGSANSNALTISGGTSLGGSGIISLFGGRVLAGSGTASDNTVTITSFTQSNDSVFVYGGRSEGTGNVLDNTVGIASGNTNNFMTVYGGYATSGAATGNIVTIDGGGQIENVVGGYAYSGNAGGNSGQGNIVNVTGGNANILYGLTGGRSTSGSVSYNEVQIGSGYAGTISGGVNGGWVVSGSGNAEHNSVVINGGTIQGGAAVIGGQSTNGAATGNSVTITGGTVGGDIHGGETLSGSATDNTVTITTTGKTYQNIYGGYTSWNTTGDLFTGNTLNLNTGNTVSSVHNMATLNFTSGGNAGIGILDTTATGAGGNPLVTINTNANAVTIDGVINGTGGIEKNGAGTLSLSGANTYTGMTEVRAGTLALSGSLASNLLTLYGGTTFDASGGTHSLDNGALHVHGQAAYTGNLSAQNALLNFYVPTTMNNGGAMLNVTGTADITGGTVNVGIEGGSSPLKAGDSVVLIDAGTLIGAPTNTTANGQGMQGVTLLYDFTLSTTANQLLATVASGGVTVNPQLKSLSEGRAAGHAFLNQGSDLILGPGLNAMLTATQGTTQSPAQGGFVPFFAGAGGWSRYDTGSHVDVSGVSIMTGLAWRQPVNEGKNGSVLAGAFFEAGWGNYDSHNSFSNVASVKGDGDTSYYGGGILARYDLTGGLLAGLYTEASLRAGYASTDFSSNDFGQTGGTSASYDSGAAYYGAHAGLGYIWRVNDAASLDFSTKYLWTHQESDSVTVAGDPVRFKAADSQRWRNGARFNYVVLTSGNVRFTPYIGAAYEYEFDGKARATAYGRGIDSPSLKGGTGVGELGVSFKPVADGAFGMDLGVQGYTGKREGVTGSLRLQYEF